jgi:hypothetical protein
VWLCELPIRWRMPSLPSLLEHYTAVRRPESYRCPSETDQAMRIVRQMCRLQLFQGPLFSQACRRRALALYHLLSQLNDPVAIHFGVDKVREALRGHSWSQWAARRWPSTFHLRPCRHSTRVLGPSPAHHASSRIRTGAADWKGGHHGPSNQAAHIPRA